MSKVLRNVTLFFITKRCYRRSGLVFSTSTSIYVFFLSFRPLLYLFNHLDWLFLGLLQKTIDIFGLFTEQMFWQCLGPRKKAFDKKYHIIGNILHYNYCVIIYIVTITNKTLFSYNHFIYILPQNKFLAKFHEEETSRVREISGSQKDVC